jgi:hypothetical protein
MNKEIGKAAEAFADSKVRSGSAYWKGLKEGFMEGQRSQPEPKEQTSGEQKCTLSNSELIEAVEDWVSKLCKSGGQAWTLQVPVNFNRDPDMLIIELCKRLRIAYAPLPTPAVNGYYEAYINSKHCEGWFPVDTSKIEQPERIPEYIERGLLRIVATPAVSKPDEGFNLSIVREDRDRWQAEAKEAWRKIEIYKESAQRWENAYIALQSQLSDTKRKS